GKEGGRDGNENGDAGKDEERRGDAGAAGEPDEPAEGDGREQQSSSRPPPTPPTVMPDLGALGNVLKWIVGGLIALIVIFFVARALLRWLANFTHWANKLLSAFQRFWDRLMRWWHGELPEAILDMPQAEPPKPFVTFRNPFSSGEADRMSPAEIVRY